MVTLRYHHLGIPTGVSRPGERYLPAHKVYVSGFDENDYHIEWMRFEADCPLPELVKTVPHVAFVVDDLSEAVRGRKVIIEPNSPSDGVVVAFIEDGGAPVELMQLGTSPHSV